MPADIKAKLGAASGTALTITLDSLATDGARQSTVIDNSSNLFLDALVQVTIVTPAAGTIASSKAVYIYAYGALEAASPEYPSDGTALTGSDAAATLTDPTNMKPIGVIVVAALSKTYRSNPMSVAAAFGGILPPKWGIVVLNKTNVTLESTGNGAKYLGVLAQSV